MVAPVKTICQMRTTFQFDATTCLLVYCGLAYVSPTIRRYQLEHSSNRRDAIWINDCRWLIKRAGHTSWDTARHNFWNNGERAQLSNSSVSSEHQCRKENDPKSKLMYVQPLYVRKEAILSILVFPIVRLVSLGCTCTRPKEPARCVMYSQKNKGRSIRVVVASLVV